MCIRDSVVGAVCYAVLVVVVETAEVVLEAAVEAVGVSAAGIVGVAAVVEVDVCLLYTSYKTFLTRSIAEKTSKT